MTNEQAVRWLKDLLKSDLPMEQYQTALEKGIKALEQRTGHWVNDECGNVICSECKRFRRDCRYGHTNYCNHCGARMVEPQERSDKE